jgi:hypothetical protein
MLKFFIVGKEFLAVVKLSFRCFCTKPYVSQHQAGFLVVAGAESSY